MRRLTAFFTSMAGRIFLILLLGVTLSATVAWQIAGAKRLGDLRRLDMARAVDRVEDTVIAWKALPPAQRAGYAPAFARGIDVVGAETTGGAAEPVLDQLLAARLPGVKVAALRMDRAACAVDRGGRGGFGGGPGGPDGDRRGGRGGGFERGGNPDFEQQPEQRRCWLVTVQDGASQLRLVAGTQPRPAGRWLPDPLYMSVLFVGAALLAFMVARFATIPLRHLSQAATSLGDDLTRQPLPLTGPSELREAATAFNAMQVRLQRQLAERTHMLAAITHDLQTPVTRLRLRLEKVDDPELRERLLGDLSAMQTLIREGLDLARSAEHSETPMRVDLQSLVDSLVDDAADAGQDVTGGERCDVDVTLQPAAMSRCLSNLIGNALKYGGSAEVSVAMRDGAPEIRVRDHGPGLPEDQLAGVFEPFVRLEDSRSRETGGVGLGLTIARTLAERNGATITLANHPDGGAEAVIRFRKAG
ncbi:MAG: hypothetical protein BGN86_03245 [Caulobacterales bacterium 68-7]|nr:HAMP domain-containing protein [Caulobacterales bacterium]OJU08880.1 MAG: hypothetical protein BGN86_03245 [Caulobacterales bacterium 68-7]